MDDRTAAEWFGPKRFAFILGVLILAAFPKVLLGFSCFVVRDFGLYSYPVAYFHRQCFWRGEIPLWNPLDCCGVPFLAQLNTMTLYPLSLIYLLLPMPWSLPFFCLVHIFFAGMGMYFLASRWIGSRCGGALAGVIFAFNGLTMNFIMWPSHLAAFAWMPWVVLAVEDAWRAGGRKTIIAMLAAAMQILSGGPEEILLTWFILFVLMLIWCARKMAPPGRVAGQFLVIGLVAAALAAAQLLPFMDLAAHSQRDTHFGTSDWSMPALGWANFFVPLFETIRYQTIFVQAYQYWTSSYYAGIGVICLAIVAVWRERTWRVWMLAGFFLMSVVLALGDHCFIYRWLWNGIPFLRLFRFPVKFVILTLWALPLLAAFGIAHYEKAETGRRRWRLEIFCVAMVLAIVGATLWFSWKHPSPGEIWPAVEKNGLERLGFFALAAVAVCFLAKPWARFALILIVWLDLMTHVPSQNPTVEPSLYQPGLAALKMKLDPMPVAGESRFMMARAPLRELYFSTPADPSAGYLVNRVVLMSDCNLLDDIPKVDGFFPMISKEMQDTLKLFDSVDDNRLSPLKDLLGVSQITAPGKTFDFVARPSYMPMITAGAEPVFAGQDAAFHALAQTNIDFRKVIYLPLEARSKISAANAAHAQIVSREIGPNRLSVVVETPAPAMVLIAQAYYRDWKARVDGQPVPLWRADYALQAVEVPAGRHEVKLTYEDQGFRWGGFISIAALVGCGAGYLRFKKSS